MAARQDNKTLEKSTSDGSEQALQNQSSSVSIDVALDTTSSEGCDFIESSPAVLEPSKDESRSQVFGRRQHFSRKVPSPTPLNAERAPVVASSQRNVCDVQQQEEQLVAPIVARGRRIDDVVEQQVEQQIDGQVEIPRTDCFAAFYGCYNNSVIKFRNSSFIYLIQILFSFIFISSVVVGFVYLDKCPKAIYLPGLGVGTGMLWLLFMGLWMTISRLNRRGTTCSAKQKCAFVVFIVLLILASIVEAVLVYCLVPNSDPASKDYCSETFYTYARYKEVATAVVVAFSTLLYFPGMCHTLFCDECSLINSGRYYAL